MKTSIPARISAILTLSFLALMAANASAQAPGPGANVVTAENVQKVDYNNPIHGKGSLTFHGNHWEELTQTGRNLFEEVERDEWSVHLFDKSRRVAMNVNITMKKITYGSADAAKMLDQVSGVHPITAMSKVPTLSPQKN